MIYTTPNRIREHKPCADGWRKLLTHLGKTEADEALLRQALEALEYYRSGEDYQPTPASEAITALHARLREKA